MNDSGLYQVKSKVLVIGAGLGGIKAALDLAESGRDVLLIDKEPAIGGLMTRLDRTFPTNNCDLCTLSPHLAESGRQLHVELLPMTQLYSLKVRRGNSRRLSRQAPVSSISRNARHAGSA